MDRGADVKTVGRTAIRASAGSRIWPSRSTGMVRRPIPLVASIAPAAEQRNDLVGSKCRLNQHHRLGGTPHLDPNLGSLD